MAKKTLREQCDAYISKIARLYHENEMLRRHLLKGDATIARILGQNRKLRERVKLLEEPLLWAIHQANDTTTPKQGNRRYKAVLRKRRSARSPRS